MTVPVPAKGDKLYTIRHGELTAVTFERLAKKSDLAGKPGYLYEGSYLIIDTDKAKVVCDRTRFLTTPVDAWQRHLGQAEQCIIDHQAEVETQKSKVAYYEQRVRDAEAEKEKAIAKIAKLRGAETNAQEETAGKEEPPAEKATAKKGRRKS